MATYCWTFWQFCLNLNRTRLHNINQWKLVIYFFASNSELTIHEKTRLVFSFLLFNVSPQLQFHANGIGYWTCSKAKRKLTVEAVKNMSNWKGIKNFAEIVHKSSSSENSIKCRRHVRLFVDLFVVLLTYTNVCRVIILERGILLHFFSLSICVSCGSSRSVTNRHPFWRPVTDRVYWTCMIFLPYTSHIFREPLDYIKHVFNYLDLSGYLLVLVTYVLRFLESDAQWTCASLAILINFIGIFKYSAFDR